MEQRLIARGAQRLGSGLAAQLRCGVQIHEHHTTQSHFTIDQFAVVWLASGRAVVHCRDRQVTVEVGDAFHRFPLVPHDVTFSAGTTSYYLALPAECLSLLRMTGVPAVDDLILHIGDDRDLRQRWERRIDDLSSAPATRLAGELLALCELCADLHRRAALAPGRHDGALDRACILLAAQLHRRISVTAIAKQVGLAYCTFRSAFSKRFGVGPGEWRIHRRMERAQELLLDGSSIDAIASDLGYLDRNAFASDFRRHCGEPPGRWRASFR